MADKKFSHKDLCDIAVKWLLKSHSAKGPGCQFAVSEIQACTPLATEIADAFGYRCNNVGTGGWLVEVKMSRSDFLADFKKPHRVNPANGVGRYRMFLCPEGVIKKEEVPNGWGLLYVNSRGHVKPQIFMNPQGYNDRKQWLSEHEFVERNTEAELYIMCRLLQRFQDLEQMNQNIKEASRLSSRAWAQVDKLNEEISKIERRTAVDRLLVDYVCEKHGVDREQLLKEADNHFTDTFSKLILANR